MPALNVLPVHGHAMRPNMTGCHRRSSPHSVLFFWKGTSVKIAPGILPVAIHRINRTQLCKSVAEDLPISTNNPVSYVLPVAKKCVIDFGGQPAIYCTACCSSNPTGDGSFLPLTVNYQEKFSAAGRTSGGFNKRDDRPKQSDILISRLVDRPIRPMFEDGWANDTQVLQWVLSYDDVNPPEPLAITAAGAALLVSDIPLKKAVAGVRVGWMPDGSIIVNPTVAQMASSKLDLMLAGTSDAILMIEGFADFLTEEQVLQAVETGAKAVSSICQQMEVWAKEVGKSKRNEFKRLPEGLEETVRKLVGSELEAACRVTQRGERSALVDALKARTKEALVGENGAVAEGGAPLYAPVAVDQAFKSVQSQVMRQLVLKEGRRLDGRSVTQIRPIVSRASVLARTHGSALFTRGETQALAIITLGRQGDAQLVDTLRTAKNTYDRFMLHYFFPPSSVGETGRTGGPGRRELGHGELAERALTPILPSVDAFPYSMRVESIITESNGSSSMASVCGGCLALMDAGVPVKRPVAGIAMGLVLEPSGEFVVLSDILGAEDALGDMDLKVAGDANSITAFQMDIKVEGITLPIMAQALAQAKAGRTHILEQMQKCNPAPSNKLSRYAPKILTWQMTDLTKKGALIGPGGRMLRSIIDASGVESVDLDEVGRVEVCGPTSEAVQKAMAMVQAVASDPVADQVMSGTVMDLAAFGVFVEIAPGRQGLVHVSELSWAQVADPADVVKVGDVFDVKVLGVTPDGKIRLSRKALMPMPEGTTGSTTDSEEEGPSTPRTSEGYRPGGRGGRGGYVGGRGGMGGRQGGRRREW